MDKTITICTVNYNSSEFIELMLSALEKLTTSPYKVIIRDNNSKQKDYKNLERIADAYKNISVYRNQTDLRGSIAHGEALNELVSKIDTPYGVIIDADATFLLKDWDNILINKLDEKTPIFGTQADRGGGKPMDFPLMFAVIFKTEILKNLNIDFRPRDLSKMEDTGWELREKYLSANLSGGMLYSFNTRQFKGGPFREIISTEYYISEDGGGKIFAAHFGRGSAPKSKNLIKIKTRSNIFLRMVNKIISFANVMKWQSDKQKWIDISHNIIDNQII